MKMLVIAAMLVAGCVESVVPGCDTRSEADSPRYLCVGMESSARFGSCPGCATDAKNMTRILSESLGYEGDTLISGQATKSAVVSKLRQGIDSTPADGLFLFIYSGHGGQEYLGGSEPSGADREDEYLCLYDTYMTDDEIWSIVSRCKGRVFLYFDACHSATMYRSVASELKVGKLTPENGAVSMYVQPDGSIAMAMSAELVPSKGFTFDIPELVSARAMSADSAGAPRILCWSGCKESEYSYGGSSGGVMTGALVRSWHSGISYSDLWKKVVSGVRSQQPTQHPVQTAVGSGFGDSMEAFK